MRIIRNRAKYCECGCGQTVPPATYTAKRRGYIAGKSNRFLHGHNARRVPFEEKYVVDPVTGCWNWVWKKYRNTEYGLSGEGAEALAHRESWTRVNGPIPEGRILLHSCDNPSCVNPGHLSVGTYSDNSKDAVAKGRVRPIKLPPFSQGVRHPLAKLDEEKVRQIRHDYGEGIATIRGLARQYGVDKKAIQLVIRRETWTHV